MLFCYPSPHQFCASYLDGQAVFGTVDLVFANAGSAGEPADITKVQQKQIQDTVDTNFYGVLRTLQAAVPNFDKAKGGAFIVNSSIVSVLNFPKMLPYIASKAAVDGLIRVAAAELAEQKVDVYGVSPFVFTTDMPASVAQMMGTDLATFAAMTNPSRTAGDPAFLARLVQDLAEGKLKNQYPSGTILAVDSNEFFPLFDAPAKIAAAAAATAATASN